MLLIIADSDMSVKALTLKKIVLWVRKIIVRGNLNMLDIFIHVPPP
jgi:hypothetical protein